ncbi:MAG: hypothetical protein ACI3VZ_08325 [Faecousia sp.]
MARLIDVRFAQHIANVELSPDAAGTVQWVLSHTPTVDAVEVVRCRDCKWAEYGKDFEPYCNHWKSCLYADIKDDDFCSYGERKDCDGNG